MGVNQLIQYCEDSSRELVHPRCPEEELYFGAVKRYEQNPYLFKAKSPVSIWTGVDFINEGDLKTVDIVALDDRSKLYLIGFRLGSRRSADVEQTIRRSSLMISRHFGIHPDQLLVVKRNSIERIHPPLGDILRVMGIRLAKEFAA